MLSVWVLLVLVLAARRCWLYSLLTHSTLTEWLAVMVQGPRRQLLYIERQLTRKLYREYRAQLR